MSASKKKKSDDKPALTVEKASIFNGKVAILPDDEEAAASLPIVYECLMPKYRDGAMTRQSGSISIGITGSLFSITLRCPTEGKQVSFASNRLLSVFADLEAYLAKTGGNWVLTFDEKKKAGQALAKLLES